MSKYTTQVRWIVEQFAENAVGTTKFDNLTIYQKIDEALPLIFNFSFPIWNESYRTTLEKKIIMHYFNKEIGMETVFLWQFYLNERLNLIMPYYNKLYETTVQDFDYLQDFNMSETKTRNVASTDDVNYKGNGTSTGTENSKSVDSDFPQATLSGLDYATTSNESESNTNTSTQTTSENKATRNEDENYTLTRNGLNGSHTQTQMLQEYRDALINIDFQVIEELKDLFMMIY